MVAPIDLGPLLSGSRRLEFLALRFDLVLHVADRRPSGLELGEELGTAVLERPRSFLCLLGLLVGGGEDSIALRPRSLDDRLGFGPGGTDGLFAIPFRIARVPQGFPFGLGADEQRLLLCRIEHRSHLGGCGREERGPFLPCRRPGCVALVAGGREHLIGVLACVGGPRLRVGGCPAAHPFGCTARCLEDLAHLASDQVELAGERLPIVDAEGGVDRIEVADAAFELIESCGDLGEERLDL